MKIIDILSRGFGFVFGVWAITIGLVMLFLGPLSHHVHVLDSLYLGWIVPIFLVVGGCIVLVRRAKLKIL